MHTDVEMDYMADTEEEQVQEQTDDHLQCSNVRELEMLRREIDHLQAQGISPPVAWYEQRYLNLQTYSELGWSCMAHSFYRIDSYIHNTSLNILNNLEDLMEEHHRNQYFNLCNYQHLIRAIWDLWTYYKTTYIGSESDPDVGDLIVGLTHLMSHL